MPFWTGLHGAAQLQRVADNPLADCRSAFARGADIIWAGRGHVAELGLVPVVTDHREGDVYIALSGDESIAPRGRQVFCAVYPDGFSVGAVPQGWQPP